MAKGRYALNPAKVKADIAALEEHPPPEVLAPRLDIRRRPSVMLLCVLSSAVLLISFAPYDCWYLAYVALVPWGLAVVGGKSGRWAMLWSFLAGALFWAAGTYWLTWITMSGFFPLVAYLGLYWLVAGWLLRKAFQRGWPSWLVLPVIWVALEYARVYALSGFPWFNLAHTQYRSIRLIQLADLTGTYGVSFFVAMVNGAIIDALAQPLFVRSARGVHLTRLIGVAAAACLLTAAGMMGYGAYRLRQETVSPGPKIGVVQMAFPISLDNDGPPEGDILGGHIQNSLPLIGKGCDLVVWPESMLEFREMDPAKWFALDPDAADPGDPSRRFYSPEAQKIIRDYHRNLRRLRELVDKLGCPLLAGGGMPTAYLTPLVGERVYCNSALLYDRGADGELRLRRRYDKMHLVPFGEYVPFRESWRWMYLQLRRCVPDDMPQVEPGRRVVRFEITAGTQEFRFATPICYEGTFARVCRKLLDKNSPRGARLLVNISNDGWFIYNGRRYIIAGERVVHASTELEQHLVQYVFRAIENRVPVIRAVNTGISANVDSYGRIEQVVVSGGGRRKMVAGNLVVQSLVDSRVTVYSLAGDVFAQAVCLTGVVGVAVMILRRRRKGKEVEA